MDLSDKIDSAALLIAIVGFAIGLLQYRRAQAWKKAEFVAQEFKQFESDPVVSNALTLLDWNPMYIALQLDGSEEQKHLISHKDLVLALRPHTEVPDGFEPPYSN